MKYSELLKNVGAIIDYLNSNREFLNAGEIKELSSFIAKVIAVMGEIVNSYAQYSNDNFGETEYVSSKIEQLSESATNLIEKYHI